MYEVLENEIVVQIIRGLLFIFLALVIIKQIFIIYIEFIVLQAVFHEDQCTFG